jgi:hypothetical protein
VKRLLIICSVTAIVIVIVVSFIYCERLVEKKKTRAVYEYAHEMQIAIEKYCCDNDSYPINHKFLWTEGYLTSENTINPFSGEPYKIVDYPVEYEYGVDIYLGKVPFLSTTLSGLVKGDIVFIPISLSSVEVQSSKQPSDNIGSYMIVIIDKPEWKPEDFGSPALSMLTSATFDFKIDWDMIERTCPYRIGYGRD